MVKRPDDPRPAAGGTEPDEEEVEILEIVGVEEDPGEMAGPPPARVRAGDPGEDDYVLSFEDEAPGPGPDGSEVPEGASELPERQQLLRLAADYENLRRRVDRERREFETQAGAGLVSRLLPVLDNLERALGAEPASAEAAAIHEGLRLIHKHLLHELRKEGLQAIESVGRPFDPRIHEAVATDRGSSRPGHVVVEELQRGYLFRERLLRPALVRVSMDGRGDGPNPAASEGN